MNEERTSLRKLLLEEMNAKQDFTGPVKCTMEPEDLKKEFNNFYGSDAFDQERPPFFYWTHKRVYFVVYRDGLCAVGSVPRDPCDETPYHVCG